MNKQKIQKLVNKLEGFEGKTSESVRAFENELSQLVKKMKSEVTLTTLESINQEIRKLKKLIDSGPLFDSISSLREEIRSGFSNTGELSDELKSEYNNVLARFESIVFKYDEFDKRFSSLKNDIDSNIEKQIKSADAKLASFVDEMQSSNASDKKTTEKSISNLSSELKSLKNEVKNFSVKGEYKTEIEEIRALISRVHIESLSRGGGSMNRQILIGGTNYLTRYTDINFIAGAGITITAANDNANRRVNLTIISSGSSSFETPVGSVDDSNLTFTVSNTPKYIIVNGAQYLEGTGLYASYSAPTITLNSPVGTGGFIRSAY